eukprot:COSAG05_NODE_18183_length_312_cov_0.943662_1_plen_54_part_10
MTQPSRTSTVSQTPAVLAQSVVEGAMVQIPITQLSRRSTVSQAPAVLAQSVVEG